MAKVVTANMRRELVEALRSRYKASSWEQKGRILAEFVATSGYLRIPVKGNRVPRDGEQHST